MSGVKWNGNYLCLQEMSDDIEETILKNNKKIPFENLSVESLTDAQLDYLRSDGGSHCKKENYEKASIYYSRHTSDTIRNYGLALYFTRLAEIYLHRIDWFESGDDGESDFNSRLKDDLKELKENFDAAGLKLYHVTDWKREDEIREYLKEKIKRHMKGGSSQSQLLYSELNDILYNLFGEKVKDNPYIK